MTLHKTWMATLLTATLLLGAAGTAAAHTTVEDETGQYQFVAGFRNEPVFAGERNGLDLQVYRLAGNGNDHDGNGDHGHNGDDEDNGGHGHSHGERVPVSGLVGSISVTYEYAGETYTPELRAQWGQEGRYTAEITPTREGTYTLRVTGEIDGTPIDLEIAVDSVRDLTTTMFPASDFTREETTHRIQALEGELEALRAELAALGGNPGGAQGDETNAAPAPAGVLVALLLAGLAFVVGRRR